MGGLEASQGWSEQVSSESEGRGSSASGHLPGASEAAATTLRAEGGASLSCAQESPRQSSEGSASKGASRWLPRAGTASSPSDGSYQGACAAQLLAAAGHQGPVSAGSRQGSAGQAHAAPAGWPRTGSASGHSGPATSGASSQEGSQAYAGPVEAYKQRSICGAMAGSIGPHQGSSNSGAVGNSSGHRPSPGNPCTGHDQQVSRATPGLGRQVSS